MVNVIEIDIGELGVQLPRGEVGMVIAQPFVELVPLEPFTIRPENIEAVKAGIDNTLAVALRCAHGIEKTHFTIFPECSIPGLAGFDRISTAMSNIEWPTGTFIIGGIDGLTRQQFGELIARPNAEYDNVRNNFNRIREDQWVNCCVIWAKLDTGEVRAWIQPKIEPAWVERNVNHMNMFRGQSVFLFKGTFVGTNMPYRFATLICFDWIGSQGEHRVWEWLLRHIDESAGAIQAIQPLTWLFIAQFNPGPSHPSFMSQVQPFFNQVTFPNVLRNDTSLIMANVAGKPVPGATETFGRSAVISANTKFNNHDCPPTFCHGGEAQRPGNPLENLKDAVFRERGACIHSFRLLNPSVLPLGAAGRRFVVDEATVHPIQDINDPRATGGIIPAVVKWINDELDDPEKSLQAKNRALPMALAAGAAHQRSVNALRWLPAASLSKTILISSPNAVDSPDRWNITQSIAVKHVLHTFSIFDAAQYPVVFHGTGAQATIVKGEQSIEVVAVIGRSHEECDKHIISKLPGHRGQLLVVSRDDDNNSWDPRMRTIFDQNAVLTTELNITDPTSAVIRVGYRDILDAYHSAANELALKDAIDAAIS